MLHTGFGKSRDGITTISIILVTTLVFIIQGGYEPATGLLSLNPIMALSGSYWQFITYLFVHGSVAHLVINMFGLLIFGFLVEKSLGVKKYLALYFLSGIGSAVIHILITGISDIILLGASGAVFGVLTAFAVLYPDVKLMVFPIPMPISAKFIVIGFILISLFLGVTNIFNDNIAYFGHLGGILSGLAITYVFRRGEKKDEFNFPKDVDFFWQ